MTRNRGCSAAKPRPNLGQRGIMSKLDRRDLIGAALLLAPAAAHAASAADGVARGPDYWRAIAAQYDITREIVQFENGMWGMMPRPVMEAYRRKTEMVNRRN